MNDFFEKLKKYFEETPQEKIEEDWSRSSEFDKIGTTVEDFLVNSQYYHVVSSQWHLENIMNDYSPKFSSGFFLTNNI